jgi:hypothetical protein
MTRAANFSKAVANDVDSRWNAVSFFPHFQQSFLFSYAEEDLFHNRDPQETTADRPIFHRISPFPRGIGHPPGCDPEQERSLRKHYSCKMEPSFSLWWCYPLQIRIQHNAR